MLIAIDLACLQCQSFDVRGISKPQKEITCPKSFWEWDEANSTEKCVHRPILNTVCDMFFSFQLCAGCFFEIELNLDHFR